MTTFQIFKPDNKTFHLNIENVLFVLLVIFGVIGPFLEHTIFFRFINYAIGIILISGFILMFANMFRIKPIYGKLDGFVIFDSEYLIINDKVYSFESIKKLLLE